MAKNKIIEDYVNPSLKGKNAPKSLPPIPPPDPPAPPIPPTDNEIDTKRESLAILATIGNTKEFNGVNMSLGAVHRLSEEDVEKYYVRYQAVLGQQLTEGLVDSGIEAASKVTSYVLPVDDSEKLYST